MTMQTASNQFSKSVKSIIQDSALRMEVVQKTVNDNLKRLATQASPMIRACEDAVAHHQDFFKQAEEFRRSLFSSTQFEALLSAQKEMREQMERLSEGFAQHRHGKFLLKNGWFFTPYLNGKSIEKDLANKKIVKKKSKELNQIFESFFCKNDYAELETMIKSWLKNKFFKRRMQFFSESLIVLRIFRSDGKNKSVNPCNIILPTLIIHTEGIIHEYTQCLNQNLPKKEKRKGNNFKFPALWELPCRDGRELFAIEMLEDCLFASARRGKQPKNKLKQSSLLGLNRHKIMHGENIKYGRIDNVLRIFLLLDFLANS